MAIDHSLTYKKLRLKNIPHILRKRTLTQIIKKIKKGPESYADFGCSNGYLTNIFSKILNSKSSYGFDHSDNIAIATENYPEIKFKFIDLNLVNKLNQVFDIITCFETLEHVGDTYNALKNIKNHSKPKSIILISVPIEIGLIGIFKFFIKRFLLQYKLPLKCNNWNYFLALIKGSCISNFRFSSNGYSSHFGFDYRVIDFQIDYIFEDRKIEKWNSVSTRFYRITCN